jgi:hypothetical protein
MSCMHCGSPHQPGRFCYRCGKKLLLAVPYDRGTSCVRRSTARGGPAGGTGSLETR